MRDSPNYFLMIFSCNVNTISGDTELIDAWQNINGASVEIISFKRPPSLEYNSLAWGFQDKPSIWRIVKTCIHQQSELILRPAKPKVTYRIQQKAQNTKHKSYYNSKLSHSDCTRKLTAEVHSLAENDRSASARRQYYPHFKQHPPIGWLRGRSLK